MQEKLINNNKIVLREISTGPIFKELSKAFLLCCHACSRRGPRHCVFELSDPPPVSSL